MVGHQYIGVDVKLQLSPVFPPQAQVSFPILVGQKQGLPVVTPGGYVVEGVGCYRPGLPSHLYHLAELIRQGLGQTLHLLNNSTTGTEDPELFQQIQEVPCCNNPYTFPVSQTNQMVVTGNNVFGVTFDCADNIFVVTGVFRNGC